MPLHTSFPAGARLVLATPTQWHPPPPPPLSYTGWLLHRPFHTTSPRRDDRAAIDNSANHYETLKLGLGATPAEIKKSFYTLSKTHHPDHNHSDPSASSRFMRISDAYNTLSSAEKRSRYDRDVLGVGRGGPAPRGSYSSTNQAGGRPASGLSRRRSAFRGPPPSFYRSGGWGTHSQKRSAAHDETTAGAASGEGRTRDHHNDGSWINENSSSGFGAGGMGPGQDPFRHRDDVPHFDHKGHERTQRKTEEHRTRSWRTRMGDNGERIEYEPEKGPTGMLIVISGVLMMSFLGPFLFSRVWADKKSKRSPSRP